MLKFRQKNYWLLAHSLLAVYNVTPARNGIIRLSAFYDAAETRDYLVFAVIAQYIEKDTSTVINL